MVISFCLNPLLKQAHAEAGRELDETSAVLPVHPDRADGSQPGRLHLHGRGRRRRGDTQSAAVRQEVLQELKVCVG